MTTLLKLQRSLSTTADAPQVLAYNEQRTFMVEQSLTPDLQKWLGASDKVFVKARVKNGAFTVLNAAKAQRW